jgi:two-component system nitrogen regulation response regulator GlnG
VDRTLLPLVLYHTSGNQHQAARLRGIARQTLGQKLRDLGLHVAHSVEADEDDRRSMLTMPRTPISREATTKV